MRAVALTSLLLLSEVVMAAELPRTVAESSNYRSTSRYEDVMSFIAAVQRADPEVRVEPFATTNEGRALPLVIAGPPGIVDPRSAHATGLPIVFIMANIHAGEVEGKEAAQMVLRDLVSSSRALRDQMVVLIAPIYNADGNERFGSQHRPTQNGPPNGVGVRENAQGLDLNRDYMKLETPEARGLIANVLHRWDPLLTVDLHTTNGSYHGYALTYSPTLNPDAPPAPHSREDEIAVRQGDISLRQFRRSAQPGEGVVHIRFAAALRQQLRRAAQSIHDPLGGVQLHRLSRARGSHVSIPARDSGCGHEARPQDDEARRPG
jgi:hypothetical protein